VWDAKSARQTVADRRETVGRPFAPFGIFDDADEDEDEEEPQLRHSAFAFFFFFFLRCR